MWRAALTLLDPGEGVESSEANMIKMKLPASSSYKSGNKVIYHLIKYYFFSYEMLLLKSK